MQLDIKKGSKGVIEVFQGDNIEGKQIITLIENDRLLDLTGFTCDMAYVDVDNNYADVIGNLNIYNATGGQIELPINANITKRPGVYNCELRLKDKNNNVRFTAFFSLVIKENAFSQATPFIANSKNYEVLQDLLNKADSYNQELKEATDGLALKYADDLNEINHELNKVVYKGHASLDDFNEDTRALIQGLSKGETQINAVLGEGNVTPQNTTFFKFGINLYDKRAITANKYINTDGNLLDNTAYSVTDFIEIKEGLSYRFNGAEGVARWDLSYFYKADKSLLCSSNGFSNPFVAPKDAKYVRITLYNTDSVIDNFYFCKGTEGLTPPVPYEVYLDAEFLPQIPKEKIPSITSDMVGEKAIKLENLDFSEVYGNLFNGNITKGKYVFYQSGELYDNDNYSATDFIGVEPNTQYTYKGMHGQHFAFYDKDKKYIENTNNNINPTFTTPNNAYFVRFSISTSGKDIDINNIGIVKGGTYYQAIYKYSIPKNVLNLDKDKIIGNEIADKAIEEKHLAFLTISDNLFNKDAVTKGYYVDYRTGQLLENENYCASDFIGIEPNQAYTMTKNRMLAFYDKNKNYISGIEFGDTPLTFTTPQDAYYIRFSIPTNDTTINTFMFNKGDKLKPYVPYGYVIPNSMIQQVEGFNNISLNIPNEIDVANNIQFELYNRYIIDKCNNIYYFKYSCSIGKNMKRGLIIPKGTATGTYNAKLEVFDDDLNIVATKTFNINVRGKKESVTTKKLLCIGDSLTNSKPWANTIVDNCKDLLGDTKIEFVGTRGNAPYLHEGRSGYTSTGYVTDSGYGYQGNYKIKATLTTNPVSKKKYNLKLSTGMNGVFEVEEVKVEDGATWVYLNRMSGAGDVVANSTATGVDESVTGDNTINYTDVEITSRNPFWNPNTNQVDFKYYETQNNIKADIVQLYLGTNDYSSPNYIDNMKTLINALNRDWNIPILVVLVPFRGNQDGMGIQFGTSMFYREAFDVVSKQHKKILEELQGMDNVTIVPIGLTHDSEHNFGMHEDNINSRNTEKTWYPWESIHPQQCGYEQMGDVIWSSLLKYL